MKFGTKWIYAVLVLALLVWSCSKDKKTTNPDDTTPSVSATLGQDEISFALWGAEYWDITEVHFLIIAFFQTADMGECPIAFISVDSINTVQTGNPVDCLIDLAMVDTTDIYACGSAADNDSAVATITFSRLELTTGGLISGAISGMAEHLNHQGEALRSIEIEFANIPVTE